MQKSKRRSQQYKVNLIGEISLSNLMDWLIGVYLISMVGYLALHLGGVRAETMIVSNQLFGGLVILHAIWLVMKRRDPVKINLKVFLFLPFVVYALIHWLYISPVYWLARFDFILIFQAFVILWIVVHNFRLRSQVWFLIIGLLAVAGLVVLMAYNQYFRRPDRLPMGLTLPSSYVGRATGTFGNPNNFAGLMLLVIFPTMVGACLPRLSAVVRIFCGYVALMFMLGLFLSMSRGAILSMVITFVIAPFFLLKNNKNRVIGFVFALLTIGAIAFAINEITPKTYDRVDHAVESGGEWTRYVFAEAALNIFQDYKVTGSGLASYNTFFDGYREEGRYTGAVFAHDFYLGQLSELGVVGVALLFLPLIYILFSGVFAWFSLPYATVMKKGKKFLKAPSVKVFLAGVLLPLFAISIHLWFEFHHEVPALLMWMVIYIGIIIKCAPGKTLEIRFNRFLGCLIVGAALLVGIGLPILTQQNYESEQIARKGRFAFRALYDLKDERPKSEADYLRVIQYFEEAVALDPKNADAWNHLAKANYKLIDLKPTQTQHYAKIVEKNALKALELNERNLNYWISYARAQLLLGQKAIGEKSLLRALEYGPYNPQAWYHYAHFLSHDLERKDEALIAAENAIKYRAGYYPAASKLRTKILIP